MANTRALVSRRKAVRNIRKITRTMELIATARFKKAMYRAAAATSYTKRISAIVAKLGGQKACEAALKHQLAQIEQLEATIVSVKVAPDGKSATAKVKSTYEGKKREKQVPLVKEGGRWRVSGPVP